MKSNNLTNLNLKTQLWTIQDQHQKQDYKIKNYTNLNNKITNKFYNHQNNQIINQTFITQQQNNNNLHIFDITVNLQNNKQIKQNNLLQKTNQKDNQTKSNQNNISNRLDQLLIIRQNQQSNQNIHPSNRKSKHNKSINKRISKIYNKKANNLFSLNIKLPNIKIPFFITKNINKIHSKLSFLNRSAIYKHIYLSLLILYLILNCIQSNSPNSPLQQKCRPIDLAFQAVFTFSLLIKLILIYGGISSKSNIQQNKQNNKQNKEQKIWLIIDVVTNIAGYISYGLELKEQLNRYMKAIKILRTLLIIKYSSFLNLPGKNMMNALRSVTKILLPAAILVYIYAVVGLFTFRDYEYNKCRDPINKNLVQNWTVYTAQIFLCGRKTCPIVESVRYECLNPIDYGVQPSQSQVINMIQGNGLLRYKDIWFALYSTLKQFFVTGASKLMVSSKQIFNQYYTLTYYLSFCYLLSYIYSNIFYGLMTSNTQKAQEEEKGFVLRLSEVKDIQIDYKSQSKQKDGSQQNLSEMKISSNSLKEKKNFNKKNQLEQKHNNIDQINQTLQNLKDSSEYDSNKQNSLMNFEDMDKTNEKRLNKNQQNKILPSYLIKNKSELKSIKINFFQKFKLSQPKKSKEQIQPRLSYLSGNSESIQNEPPKHDKKIQHEKNKVTKQQMAHTNNKTENQLQKQPSQIDDEVFQKLQQIFSLQGFISFARYSAIMRKYYIYQHLAVILCSINICIEYENQSQQIEHIVDAIDLAFFFLYILQMIFRGIIHRIHRKNLPFDYDFRLDLIVFTLCASGMLYEAFISPSALQYVFRSNSTSQIIRSLKYLRILVIITSTPYLQQSRIIFNSVSESIWLNKDMICLWWLVALIFSLIGYHLFHGKSLTDGNNNLDLKNGLPFQYNFQGLGKSLILTLMTVFVEEWDWFGFQQYLGAGFLVVIWSYFVLFINTQLCSKYFMSILMNELGNRLNENSIILADRPHKKILNQPQNNKITSKPIIIYQNNGNNINNNILKLQNNKQQNLNKDELFFKRLEQLTGNHNIIAEIFNQAIKNKNNKNNNHDMVVIKMSRKDKIKDITSQILKSKAYSWIRLIMIIISLVLVFLLNPLNDPQSQSMQLYQIILYITMFFFGVELMFSMFIFGLFTQKQGYLLKLINWIYIIVFIIQLLNVLPAVKQSDFIHSLLCLRIFRILIFVQMRYYLDKNMQITIISFGKLIPKVFILLIGTFIIEGFFAIIMVKLYKNDWYYCDGHVSPNTIVTVDDCLNWGGNWLQTKMNTSNFIQSIVYLYLTATTLGFSYLTVQGASLSGPGYNAILDNNSYMYYYMCGFFFFGNLIMLNVFIGLSINNYQQNQQEQAGEANLDEDDKTWLSIKTQIYRLGPIPKKLPPENKIREKLFYFFNSKYYKIVNGIFSILFILNMSFFSTDMSQVKEKTLYGFLNLFIASFLLFYILQFIAFGFERFNKLFFKLYTVAVVYIILQYIFLNTIEVQDRDRRLIESAVICCLAIRYFALLTQIDFIKKLFNLLMTVLPETTNIWMLVAITLLIYAAIGMQMFGYLRISSQINEFDQNYTSLNKAIFALLKFSLAQNPITQITDAGSSIQPNSICFEISNYQDFAKYGRMGCGNKFKSYIYFLTFNIVYIQILFSTLMAIIFTAYDKVRREQESMVNKFQLEQVEKEWTENDVTGRGYIEYHDFWMFVGKLLKIYNVDSKDFMINQTKHTLLKRMKINIYEDQKGVLCFEFHEVIESLTRIVVKQKKGGDFDTTQADKHYRNKYGQYTQRRGKMKKSFYDSSHVNSLMALKFGLKNWRRKIQTGESNQNLSFKTVHGLMNKIKSVKSTNQIKNLSTTSINLHIQNERDYNNKDYIKQDNSQVDNNMKRIRQLKEYEFQD